MTTIMMPSNFQYPSVSHNDFIHQQCPSAYLPSNVGGISMQDPQTIELFWPLSNLQRQRYALQKNVNIYLAKLKITYFESFAIKNLYYSHIFSLNFTQDEK